MDQNTQIAVTGATGFVGRHAVRELLGRGASVRALVRDVEKAGRVLPTDEAGDRLRFAQGDLFTRSAREQLLEGADACVHAVGIIREAPGGQTFSRIHDMGTRLMVESCEAAGVERFVHISALGTTDEGDTAYQRSKFAAETHVRESDLDWTILRPSLIHGPDGEFMQTAKGWVTGKGPPHMFIPYFQRHVAGPPLPGLAKLEDAALMPVAVEDVAWAIGESLERGVSVGEIYNLVGPERVTMPELLRVLRERVPLAKKGLPMIPMPDTVGVAVARTARLLGLGDALPYDEGMAKMAGRDATATLDKAREHLGFDPRPCLETVAGYADRL